MKEQNFTYKNLKIINKIFILNLKLIYYIKFNNKQISIILFNNKIKHIIIKYKDIFIIKINILKNIYYI